MMWTNCSKCEVISTTYLEVSFAVLVHLTRYSDASAPVGHSIAKRLNTGEEKCYVRQIQIRTSDFPNLDKGSTNCWPQQLFDRSADSSLPGSFVASSQSPTVVLALLRVVLFNVLLLFLAHLLDRCYHVRHASVLTHLQRTVWEERGVLQFSVRR